MTGVVLPGASAATPGAAAPVVEPKVVDGAIADWTGASPMIGGESVTSRGEFIYQDYLYDDAGAAVVRDPSALVDRNFRGGLQPGGTTTYPDNPDRYGTNAADLLELRVARSGDRVFFLAKLNTLLAEDSTVVGIALGDDGTAQKAWPLGAGLSTPGTRQVLTLWGTGGALGDRPLAEVGGDVAVSLTDNAIEASLPVALVGERFRAYAATGLWDVATGRWMGIDKKDRTKARPGGGDGAHPNAFNVAFRVDEPDAVPGRTWWEFNQAKALAAGDIAKYRADVDLSAPDTPARMITGFHQRIYRSPVTVAPHEGISEAFGGAVTGGSADAAFGRLSFLGPWQPYAVYVPPTIERMTLLLHGAGGNMFTATGQRGHHLQLGDNRNSVLVEPLGRGVASFYKNEAYLSVLDAVRDAAAAYPVDPALTTVGGLSMGGNGTSRFLITKPDMFAAGVAFSGCYGEAGPCNGDDATLEYWENIRNVPLMINHGVQDVTVPYALPLISIGRLDALGYRYEFLSNRDWGHNTVQDVDNFAREFAFLQGKRIEANPAHVTFKPPSEAVWAPQLSPDLVFDRAYWVSGLRVRDTSLGARSRGLVDALTRGRGGEDLVTAPVAEAYPNGPPTPYTLQARRAVPGAAPITKANDFTATLTNLRVAGFDLARMGLTTSQPLTATVTTDGATDVRLVGAGAAVVQGAPATRAGDDVIVNLPRAGRYELRVLAAAAPVPVVPEAPAAALLPLLGLGLFALFLRRRRRRMSL